MFSQSNFLLQKSIMINSYRNLSFKQLKEMTPIITRNLAWFSRQPIKQSFGNRIVKAHRIDLFLKI